ncbi:MAG: type II toxin-antitoxin system VapC family toxin [Acidimicrobiales bacterium]
MILVDTDVLIAHLRGHEQARTWLRQARAEGPLAVSVVSIAELTGGMRSVERRGVWSLVSALRVQPVTELVGRRAGELMRSYRRSHSGIGIADYLIAATAEHHGARLATLNVRHFPMFPDLRPPFPLG